MLKGKLSLFLSPLIIVGFLVTGCSQAQPATTTPSSTPVVATPAPAPAPPAEDPSKVIKGAIETYFSDIGSKVTNSYKISEKDLKDALDKLSLIHISEPTRRTPISY